MISPKFKAIQDMPPPVDKKELKNMLGMINYLAKCAPQLSETTKPIRDLKDDAEFLCDQPQRDALDRTKAIILSYRSSIQPSQSLYKWMQANTA